MAFALTMLWHTPAAGDWTATLPLFDACSPSSAPELPARWRAVALMMPFLQGQIDVGEFVYDRDVCRPCVQRSTGSSPALWTS